MSSMEEKLIEILSNSGCAADTDTYKELADCLIANGVTIQQWMPAREQTPPMHLDCYENINGSRVWYEISDWLLGVDRDGEVQKVHYERGTTFAGWCDEVGTVHKITHWTYMPQLPKKP